MIDEKIYANVYKKFKKKIDWIKENRLILKN